MSLRDDAIRAMAAKAYSAGDGLDPLGRCGDALDGLLQWFRDNYDLWVESDVGVGRLSQFDIQEVVVMLSADEETP